VDRFNNLWLGTKDGLYKISIEDGACDYQFYNHLETEGGLLSDSIYDIIVNPADPNELWVSTDSGISVHKITEPAESPASWTQYPLTDVLVLKMRPGKSGGMYALTDKGVLIIDDTINPTVTASYPSDQSTDVPVDGPFWVTFSELMDPNATETAFTLTDANSSIVDGLFSWEGMTLKFDPNGILKSGAQYSMTVDTTASDLTGNPLSQAYKSDFETSGAWIYSTYPVQGAQSVPASGLNIQINFTRSMDPNFTESAFCLKVDPNFDPGSACVIGTFTWFSGNNSFEFTPSEALDEETNYILTIDANAKDQNGVAIPEPFTLGFKTAPISPAAWIHSTYPLPGALSVPTGLKIQINFTRAMDPDFTESAFCLKADPNFDPGSACVIGTFTWFSGNNSFEFTPSEALDEETNYILTIDANAKDQNGVSIPEPFIMGFKTGWIHSTYPVPGSQSVPTSDLKIQINFTRPMDPNYSESAFCLQVDPNFDPGSACVIGILNWYNGNRGFEFIPDKTLDQGTVYVITIDASAKDQNGEPIPETFSLKFRTVFAQRTLTFEGVGCFIQSLGERKTDIFERFKEWLNFDL
jgi:hypothetical protein